MKVSVIVTTYNRPDALMKVLNGLCFQTLIPDEVIVADDGSDPETQKYIHIFQADAPPYPLIHVWHENKGFRLAKIRNRAIKKTNGEYIIMLDGDCIPEKHFIEDHHYLAEKGFFFQGKRVLIDRQLSTEFTYKTANALSIKYVFSKNISNAHHLIRLPFFPAYSSTKLNGIRGCNMGFFKKDIFAVNGYNENFTGWGREDSELAVRLYKYGLKRKEQPFKAICFHLWHKTNDRKELVKNNLLLKKAIESNNYECVNGLLQK